MVYCTCLENMRALITSRRFESGLLRNKIHSDEGHSGKKFPCEDSPFAYRPGIVHNINAAVHLVKFL